MNKFFNFENISKKKLLLQLIILVLLFSYIAFIIIVGKKNAIEFDDTANTGRKMLSLWENHSSAKQDLIEYIETVTKKNTSHFIPYEDRIAVIDFDGTLFSEFNPIKFEWDMYLYRTLEDPNYINEAKEEEIDLAHKIQESINTKKISEDLINEYNSIGLNVYKGMTIDEFTDYIYDFMDEPIEAYKNLKKGEAFYKPMIEVINYLQSNGFYVFICGNTNSYIMRAIISKSFVALPERIIGTDFSLVSNNQNDFSNNNYFYSENDELIINGNMHYLNTGMNKVSSIMNKIGKTPVLFIGNDTDDLSIAEYITTNNKYMSKAFMVCNDDLERENGNSEKANEIHTLCEKYKWTPISIKNDWKTIYDDKVKKNS